MVRWKFSHSSEGVEVRSTESMTAFQEHSPELPGERCIGRIGILSYRSVLSASPVPDCRYRVQRTTFASRYWWILISLFIILQIEVPALSGPVSFPFTAVPRARFRPSLTPGADWTGEGLLLLLSLLLAWPACPPAYLFGLVPRLLRLGMLPTGLLKKNIVRSHSRR